MSSDWEWLKQIESQNKRSEDMWDDASLAVQIPTLIACIKEMKKALEPIAESGARVLDPKKEYACGIGCDGTHGSFGDYDVRNGHEDRCFIGNALKALTKCAEGKFEE
jgi:hypothetical protein